MQEAVSGTHSLRGPKTNLHPTPSSLYREPVRARLTPSWPPFLAPSALCVVGGPEAKKLARTTKAQRLERPTMTSHDGAGDAEGPPRQRTCFTALSCLTHGSQGKSRKARTPGVAEGVGFEPTEGTRPSTAFKAAAFVHSATPPRLSLFGDPFQSSHVRAQSFRDDHRSILLLVVLEDRHYRSSNRQS